MNKDFQKKSAQLITSARGPPGYNQLAGATVSDSESDRPASFRRSVCLLVRESVRHNGFMYDILKLASGWTVASTSQ